MLNLVDIEKCEGQVLRKVTFLDNNLLLTFENESYTIISAVKEYYDDTCTFGQGRFDLGILGRSAIEAGIVSEEEFEKLKARLALDRQERKHKQEQALFKKLKERYETKTS